MRPKGGIILDPSLDYADPNLFLITDPQGWNSCGGAVPNCQDGFVNTPKIKDELKSLRLQATQELDGVLSSLRVGANYSDREKRSEEHTSELQSLMRISYAVFCLTKTTTTQTTLTHTI